LEIRESLSIQARRKIARREHPTITSRNRTD
jgi:hypothetical protein